MTAMSEIWKIPVIPCYAPVRSLFRIRREIFKSHGIMALQGWVDQNAEISPVIFPVSREFRAEILPVNRGIQARELSPLESRERAEETRGQRGSIMQMAREAKES